MSEIRTLAELHGERVQITIELVPAAPEPIPEEYDLGKLMGALTLAQNSRDFNRKLVKEQEVKIADLRRELNASRIKAAGHEPGGWWSKIHEKAETIDQLAAELAAVKAAPSLLLHESTGDWSASFVPKEKLAAALTEVAEKGRRIESLENQLGTAEGRIEDGLREMRAMDAQINRQVDNFEELTRQRDAALAAFEKLQIREERKTELLQKVAEVVSHPATVAGLIPFVDPADHAFTLAEVLDEIHMLVIGGPPTEG